MGPFTASANSFPPGGLAPVSDGATLTPQTTCHRRTVPFWNAVEVRTTRSSILGKTSKSTYKTKIHTDTSSRPRRERTCASARCSWLLAMGLFLLFRPTSYLLPFGAPSRHIQARASPPPQPVASWPHAHTTIIDG